MAHPYKQFRQNKVQNARAGVLTKSYDDNQIEGAYAANRADRPMRASGGKVSKKGTTIVNVITGGQQQPPAPPPMPMPPPGAMPPGPPPGPPPGAMPPPGLGGAGPGPGMPPGPPMRARGGSVKSKGMDVGTKVQHDKANTDPKNMNRKRVITFNTGGGVVSFKASGGPVTDKPAVPMPTVPDRSGDKMGADTSTNQPDFMRGKTFRASGGSVRGVVMKGGTPKTADKDSKLPGGSGGGKGRLSKIRKYGP